MFLETNDAAEAFKFALDSVRTGDLRLEVCVSTIPKVNSLKPAFVLSVGDVTAGYTDARSEDDAKWSEFQGFVDRLNRLFFCATDSSYYDFSYEGASYLVANSAFFGVAQSPATSVPGPWRHREQVKYSESMLKVYARALDWQPYRFGREPVIDGGDFVRC